MQNIARTGLPSNKITSLSEMQISFAVPTEQEKYHEVEQLKNNYL